MFLCPSLSALPSAAGLSIVLLCAVSLPLAGCGHQTVYYSDGAHSEVVIDGLAKPQGEGFDDEWGGPKSIDVRVQSDEGTVEFALERNQNTLTPVCAAGVCGGVLGAASSTVATTSIVWASLVPDANPGCALLAIPALLVAAGSVIGFPAAAYFLWARQGPDEVVVNFAERRVTARPDAEVRRLRWLPKPGAQQQY